MNQLTLLAVTYYSNTAGSTVPTTAKSPFDAFIQSLDPTTVMVYILAFSFVIFLFVIWVAYIVRVWMVQTAIFQIQSDLSEMNERSREHSSNLEASIPVLMHTVTQKEEVVAEEKPSILLNLANDFIGLKKPSKAFIWSLCAVVVICIITISTIYFINR